VPYHSELPSVICKPAIAAQLQSNEANNECEKEFTIMLVVSRKVGERILIGDHISITVVKVGSGGVRIGIQAPKEMAVVREELATQMHADEQLKIARALQNGDSPAADAT
jgi:carbon storage regulator